MEKLTKRKAFNFLRSYFDVLNKIEKDEDKLSFLMSIINKQFLDEDPEGLNFLVDLCYLSQKHAIETSVKGWKRVNKTDVMGNPATDPMTNPTTNPITDPQEEEEEEEEKEEEKEKEEKQKASVFNFRKELLALGGDEQLVSDWMLVRKKLKAVDTKTSLKRFLNQVKLSGKDLNFVLTWVVSKSYKGFEADWLGQTNSFSVNKPRINTKGVDL